MKTTLLFSFLTFLLLPSCSSSRSAVPPEVYVSGLVFENLTLFETKARLSLRIDNDNPFPLEFSGGVHRFYINDVYVGKGYSKENLKIPRLSSEKHQVELSLDNLTFLTKMQQLVEQAPLRFKVKSTLYSGLSTLNHTQAVDIGIFDLGASRDGLKHFIRRPGDRP